MVNLVAVVVAAAAVLVCQGNSIQQEVGLRLQLLASSRAVRRWYCRNRCRDRLGMWRRTLGGKLQVSSSLLLLLLLVPSNAITRNAFSKMNGTHIIILILSYIVIAAMQSLRRRRKRYFFSDSFFKRRLAVRPTGVIAIAAMIGNGGVFDGKATRRTTMAVIALVVPRSLLWLWRLPGPPLKCCCWCSS